MTEDIIVATPDTTELESATDHAEQSAQGADQSAAAATAAAINQAQIIGIVTESIREDAQYARQQAETAATESEHSAELSAAIAETAISQIRSMMEEHNSRISALESNREEPVQMISNESVSPINPQNTEQSERQEDMSENGGSTTVSRKRHGRKRR